MQPKTDGFVKAQLDKPIKGPYIVEGCPTKHTLTSHIYGEGDQVTLKIVNDSEHFVTFKKGNKTDHAELAIAIAIGEAPETSNVFQANSWLTSTQLLNN